MQFHILRYNFIINMEVKMKKKTTSTTFEEKTEEEGLQNL